MALNTNVRVYDAKDIIITFGSLIIEGYGDDEFLRIEAEADDTEDMAGTDGEVAVAPTNDRRGTATLTLLQTSASNDGLSALSNAVKNNRSMTGGIVPFGVADLNGRTILEAANAWVLRAPDRSWTSAPSTLEWMIRLGHIVRIDGGN